MAHRDLNLLDASERAADKLNAAIDSPSGRRLLHVDQMRRSVQAVGANVSEGFGRGTDLDRARLLRIARGEAEETIRHLSANFRAKRVAPKAYWSIHNLLVVIVKMLSSFMRRETQTSEGPKHRTAQQRKAPTSQRVRRRKSQTSQSQRKDVNEVADGNSR